MHRAETGDSKHKNVENLASNLQNEIKAWKNWEKK